MSDATIPNTATTDLVNSILLNQVNPVVDRLPLLPLVNAPIVGQSGLSQYPRSQHGFLLDTSLGQTVEARTQAITFIGSAFQSNLTNATIIATAVPRADNQPEPPAEVVNFGHVVTW